MRRVAILAVLSLWTVAACGAGESAAPGSPATNTGTATPMTPAPSSVDPEQNAATMSPTATNMQDFRTGVGQWPTQVPQAEVAVDNGYRVTGQQVSVASPWPVSGSANRVIEAQVTLDQGRVGLFCRGSDEGRSGYRLTVSDSQEFLLERIDAQSTSTLAKQGLPQRVTSEPGEPMLVRLVCTRSEGTMLVGMTFNASQWQIVTDTDPLQTPDPHEVGIFVDGSATFDGVALLDADG